MEVGGEEAGASRGGRPYPRDGTGELVWRGRLGRGPGRRDGIEGKKTGEGEWAGWRGPTANWAVWPSGPVGQGLSLSPSNFSLFLFFPFCFFICSVLHFF